MGDDLKWKRRLPTRIYNYNYKVSEGYYKPQTEYMEDKQFIRKSPPKHQSYAERFARNPWYGDTKGLPYDKGNSAGPLIKLSDRHWRSSSLLREMKELEDEGVPLSVRASRRKKKFEEEEELLGIRPRYNRNKSWDGNKSSKDFHLQIKQKIQNLDDELMKSTRTAAMIDPPSKWNYDLDRPSRRVHHQEEYSISSPSYGTSNKKTYHIESSYSSKPPSIPNRVRKISGSDDFGMEPRVRVNSVGDFKALPRSSRRSVEEDEISLYTNRAPRLREERRLREAKEFSEDVTKLVDKMRAKKIDVDPLAAYSQGRSSRSSSIDRGFNRRGSKTSRYCYGIGKI